MYRPGSQYFQFGNVNTDQKFQADLNAEVSMFKTYLQLAQIDQIKDYQAVYDQLYRGYGNDLNFTDVSNEIFSDRTKNMSKPLDPKQLRYDQATFIKFCQCMIDATQELLTKTPDEWYDYMHFLD